MNAPLHRAIEPLEPRIAPAAVADLIIYAGKKATWTDVDGDKVTLTVNKDVLDYEDFHFLNQGTGDLGYQLALLNLSDEGVTGLSITFAARRDTVIHAGDGCVNVGWINAYHSDVNSIIVPGDLARLDVGDANVATPGLGAIVVHSAGMLGASTQDASLSGTTPTVDWAIAGRLGTMTVKTDFSANLNVFGSSQNPLLGSTGAITIGGDLLGNEPTLTLSTTHGTGYLNSGGAMGALKIKGDVRGNSGAYSGSIISNGAIASVSIGGNLSGSSGDHSGSIGAGGVLGPVTIGVDLISGSAHDDNGTATPAFWAGSISSFTKVTQVTINGDVFGGESQFGGSIFTPYGSGGKIGNVTIKGMLTGSTTIFTSGQNSTLIFNGIYSDSTLGAVKIGAISGKNSTSPVQIVARGVSNPTAPASALAITSLTVARGAYAGLVLAGYDNSLNPVNPDVQIGPVVITNNWAAGSIAAGVSYGTALDFGDGNDLVIQPTGAVHDNTAIRAKIQSISVGGYVIGTGATTDNFAFIAQEIGSVKIGTVPLEMKPNTTFTPADDFLLGITHDFHVREL